MEIDEINSQTTELEQKLNLFLQHDQEHHEFCPIRDVLDRFGDKWSLLVILNLGNTSRIRFNELKNRIDGISQRMLTVTLRSLERDGLIIRKIYAEIPPRVEYELTFLGKDLLQKIWELAQWASGSMEAILKAREAYDHRIPSPDSSAG
jgi:DNA-binding HxlR family transcriptional regulator